MKNLVPDKLKIYDDFAKNIYNLFAELRFGIKTSKSNVDLKTSITLKEIVDWQTASVFPLPPEKSVFVPITILKQPLSQAIEVGQPLILSVIVESSLPVTYQWYEDNNIIVGAIGASYLVPSYGTPNAGTYRVVITSEQEEVISNDAVITTSIVCLTPVITLQPVSQTIDYGGTYTFSVAATSVDVISYQWKKNGIDIPGATLTTYQIVNAVQNDSGVYSVIVSNVCGAVLSNTSVFTVNCAVPVIVTQPQAASVNNGADVQFSVVASSVQTMTYQWRKNGVNISGQVSSTYSITGVQPSDSATYSVVITNICGSTASANASLSVGCPTPVIVTQPQSSTILLNGNVTLSVSASGVDTYQWKKGGANISGATGSTYSISGFSAGDAGVYSVVLTNTCGNTTSNNATLNIGYTTPVITTQPAPSQNVSNGNPVTFTVVATDVLPLFYQWYKNGVAISGATNSSYNIPSTVVGSAGTYTVVVTNTHNSVTSNAAVLTINCPTPVITTQPSTGGALNIGDTLNLSVVGTGVISYQWRKNGSNISGATLSTFQITNVQVTDAAVYSVVLTNACGTTTSNTVTVSINCPVPVITTQPTAAPKNVGESITFTVVATSATAMSYQWKKNGTNISGAVNSSLTLTNLQTVDAGTYTVAVSNTCGTVTSNGAALTVNSPVTYNLDLSFPSTNSDNTGDLYTSATGQIDPANVGTPIKFEFNQIVGALTGTYSTMYVYLTSTSPANLKIIVNFRSEYIGATFRFTNTTGTQYTSTFTAGNRVI